MATHELKTWPDYWEAVHSGAKTFEVRVNDRDYKVGDTLVLREWFPDVVDNAKVHQEPGYTGRELRVQVSYILPFQVLWMGKLCVVMGLDHGIWPPVDYRV